MKVNFNITLTPSQQKAYNYMKDKDVRTLVCLFSRQQGKTVLCEILLIEDLFKPNSFSAYISPSFTLGRKVFRDILKLLEPTKIIAKANSSTLTIESIYGSTLQFFSAESPTAIRGNTVTSTLVLDEMAFYPDVLPSGEDFINNVVLPLTKAKKPKILCVSTPRGKRGAFWDYYNRALRGDKGYALVESSIYNDSLISQEEIEELKRNMPPLAFAQEFEIKFLDNALTVFQGFEDCFLPITHSYKQTWIGIDLSSSGEDATILTKINEKNEVEQFEIQGTLDSKYQQIADIINSSTNLQGVYIEINGIGSPIYNEIRKLVNRKSKLIEWLTTNSSKEKIISNLIVKIENKKISFNQDDKKLFSELSTFTVKYTKNGNMTFSAMGNAHDDRVLSLAIALECKEAKLPLHYKEKYKFIPNPLNYVE